MMSSKRSWVGAALVGAAIASCHVSSAGAAVLYVDNFDSDTAVLNWPGDSLFQSIPQPGNVAGLPSVDLVGYSNGWGTLVDGSSGNSVDLDGTTGYGYGPPDGEIQSRVMFGAGTYSLSFDLAGNLRGALSETTTVGITNDPSENVSYTPANTQGYMLETQSFTLTQPGYLFFVDTGLPSDQQGNLLDNIALTSPNANLATPLPPTWTMMLIGFAGLGFVAYRKKRERGSATA